MVGVGRTAHHADYAQIAKAYVRIGNAHLKKGETEEHLTAAIDAYEGAQMENRTKDAERKIKALQERARHGMADLEIQAILRDPVMQNVLNDFQTDPMGAQRHLQNPGIMAKIEKLIAAGVLQTK
ncbi:hypothetical protein PF010_g9336 [Phytophthora fragariae]|uniref:STI1/HOP DP domain-containing protein n=1 Tax=Phytophthora fragariae TaxID=53985 RepID=A0A6G0LBV9_9STRA|nr:hypothetical protein PF010_g9336 [Phytophthora fragariae]